MTIPLLVGTRRSYGNDYSRFDKGVSLFLLPTVFDDLYLLYNILLLTTNVKGMELNEVTASPSLVVS